MPTSQSIQVSVPTRSSFYIASAAFNRHVCLAVVCFGYHAIKHPMRCSCAGCNTCKQCARSLPEKTYYLVIFLWHLACHLAECQASWEPTPSLLSFRLSESRKSFDVGAERLVGDGAEVAGVPGPVGHSLASALIRLLTWRVNYDGA